MSKLLKNSSSQSLNVIHIKNIFINPKLIIPKKTKQAFPPINNGIFHHYYKPALSSRKYPNYEEHLAKALHWNIKKTKNPKENNKSCLNISQRNLIAVGYKFKPLISKRNNSFVLYKNKSCTISRIKM